VKEKGSRQKRKRRIRKKISGTGECPRLSVFRSAKHISAQAVDDDAGRTLAAVSSVDKKLNLSGAGKKNTAGKVGELIAEKLMEKGIKKAVFDRNGFLYHGRVAALADGARKKGLAF